MKTNFEDKKDISIKDIQAFHRYLDKEKNFDTDIIRNVAYMVAEIGELMNATRTLKKQVPAQNLRKPKSS